MDPAPYIDHTLLKPDMNNSELERLCHEANIYKFAAVCIPPNFIKYAKRILKSTPVKTVSVVGFPMGYSCPQSKYAEIYQAINDEVDEIDTVINISSVKAHDWNFLEKEIKLLLPLVRSGQKIIKVIVESGILTEREIIECCSIYAAQGVDYLKTSTGFNNQGATLLAVKLMRKYLPPEIGIKASGGIRTLESAISFILEGASRIGTSSGIKIIHEYEA